MIKSAGFGELYPGNETNSLNDPWRTKIATNPLHEPPAENKKVSSETIPTLGSSKFGAGLATWCNEINLTSEEREGRIKASERILTVYNNRIRAAALSLIGIRHRYTRLDLSNLLLTSLPDQLWELKVEVLNISNNNFAKLPDKIGGLTHLKLLYLRGFGPENDALDPNIFTQTGNKYRSLLDTTNYVYRYAMRSDCRVVVGGGSEDTIETVGEIRIRAREEQLKRQFGTFDPKLPRRLAKTPFGSANF